MNSVIFGSYPSLLNLPQHSSPDSSLPYPNLNHLQGRISIGMDSFLPNLLSDYHSSILLAVAISTLLIILTKKTKSSKSKHLNIPPGPPTWPVVGNLFQFARSGKQFMHYVRDLHPKYGPIFTLKMGTRTLIIITSPELAHKALIEQGQVFASRPDEFATRSIFSANKFTVNSSVYGPVWRSLRRNMVQEMLSNTRVKGFYNARNSAMDRLIDRLGIEADSNNGVVFVLSNVRFAVFCILLSMCFGLELDEKSIQKIDMILKKVLVTLLPRLDDFLPILGPLFLKQKKHALEVREEQIRILLPFIHKRRSILQSPVSDGGLSFSYLDTLFDLKIEGRKSCPSDGELVTLCSEFLNGGTDTTATAIEWGIARLIENPIIQAKLYDEIKSTVGVDRKVDEKDVEKMEYLNAFTKELLRKHPPTYFVLTHAVTQQTKLGGYDIPTNANIEFYTPSIAHDKTIWSNPDEFNPDRFLSGNEDADITGVKGVKMLPFGAGRRICPGLGMATIHINLMLARMVQEYEWSAAPSQPILDFSETLEFTVVMKNPLQAMIKTRT